MNSTKPTVARGSSSFYNSPIRQSFRAPPCVSYSPLRVLRNRLLSAGMRTLPQTSSFKTSPRYHRCRSSRLKRLKLTRKAALRKSPFCYVPARCPKAQNEALLELESFASREVNRFASSAERDVCSVRTFLEALLFELPSFATCNVTTLNSFQRCLQVSLCLRQHIV